MTFPVHNLARRAAVKSLQYLRRGPTFQVYYETSGYYVLRIWSAPNECTSIFRTVLSQPYKTLGEP